MKKHFIIFSTLIILTMFSCTIEEIKDPNNPALSTVLVNASKNDLQSLVTGLESRHRVYFTNATQMFGSFGREVAPFFSSDPRFGTDWYGSGTYPDFFGSAGTYFAPYQAVKQAHVLIKSVENTNAVTAQEALGYIGVAKTIKAYQLLWPLMQQYQNGIRLDVEDPFNPGPIETYATAIDYIRDLLDEAQTDLAGAGTSFAFTLKMGYNSPSEFTKVNRAIAARVALYDGDYQGALDALDLSFLDINVDAASSQKMYIGPTHVYGNSPDVANPLFYVRDQPTSTILIVHPAMVEDLLPGDARESKFYQRTNVASYSRINFPGEYQDNRFERNTDPIPFIRNEELILIQAEAFLKTSDKINAIDRINIIRNTWNLPDTSLDPATATDDQILEEILFQRRYSLWAEAGHRWIDLRRTGKLDAAHVDLRERDTDLGLINQLPPRTSETNWDANN